MFRTTDRVVGLLATLLVASHETVLPLSCRSMLATTSVSRRSSANTNPS